MFPDIGGVELIIVAIVALLVVKPQDLPVMMRRVGEFMGKARRMASDFRASFDDMARQSELDDLRKEVEAMRSKASDPMGLTSALKETEQEIQAGLSDPDFNYGYDDAGEADNSIPWDDGAGASPPPHAPKKPRAKAASKAAPKPRVAKAPTQTPIVEGGPKPKRVAAKSKSKRAS